MSNVNWKEVLVRSSCSGKVMTEGKGTVLTDKQALELERLQGLPKLTEKQTVTLSEFIAKRDAPPTLSDTCTSYLREIYQFHVYGKESTGGAKRNMAVQKGNICENESILLASRFFNEDFEKNTERKNDKYKTGEADIVWRPKRTTIDIKSVWDMESLLTHIPNPDKPNEILYDENYEWQGQCYNDLFDCDKHILSYVLVSMPEEYIIAEKKRLFYALNCVTEENPAFIKACDKLINDTTFDEIDIEQRIVNFTFERNPEQIKKLHSRWDDCRIWLEKFEKLHMNLNNR